MAGKYGPSEKKKDYKEAGQAWRGVLGRDALPPVVLMIAPSDDIYQEALKGVLDKVFKEGDRELNIQRLDAATTKSNICVAGVKVAPMMAKKRVVCVTNADVWFANDKSAGDGAESDEAPSSGKKRSTRAKKGKESSDHSDLMELASSSFKRGHVLLRAYSPDSKSALYQALDSLNAVFDFSSLGEGQDLMRNIQGELKRRGVDSDRKAVEFLADALGGNVEALFTEMDKLAGIVPPGTFLTLELARENVQRLRGHKLYELANALSERRTADALLLLSRMFDSLLDTGKKVQASGVPLMILATLELEVRKLAAAWGSKPQDTQRLCTMFGMQEYPAKKAIQNSKRFSQTELDTALRQLRDADRRIKSTGLPAKLILEDLITAICTKGCAPLTPADLGYYRKA